MIRKEEQNDNGFAEGGVWEADRWDRSLLTGSSAAAAVAATFRACLPTWDGLLRGTD